VGFIGAVGAFLALAVVGATAADPMVMRAVYAGMRVVTWATVLPLAAASLVIGIIQSLGTPWGLFRYYWVIIKLVLTVIACAVLALQTGTIDALASAAQHGNITQLGVSRAGMILHSVGGLVVLMVAAALSVYKPRGITGYGVKAIENAR
jgi:hypothetical protein